MRILHLAARPLTGSLFIMSGYDVLKNPGPAADLAGPALRRARDYIPGLPMDDEVTVRANAAVQLAAGCMLALGKAPRLSALALAVSLVPTTYAGHPWWELDDPGARAQHKTQFLKNTAIFGSLLGVLADSHGRPSLRWRAEHAGRIAAKRAGKQAKSAKRTCGSRAARAARSARR